MSLAPQSKPAIDDFGCLGVETAEELRDLFVPSFYFGHEGDPRGVTLRRQAYPRRRVSSPTRILADSETEPSELSGLAPGVA
jgi:hypothetical protein